MLQTQVRSDLPEGAAGIEPRPYKRILVAYEASASSNLALRTGRELSLLSKADLFVAAVQRLPTSDSAEAFQAVVNSALSRYQENFYRVRVAGMNEGMRVETFIALGDPAVYLVRKSQQLRVSLLIIAAAAFGEGEHEEADSVCARIVREATCPVLVTP